MYDWWWGPHIGVHIKYFKSESPAVCMLTLWGELGKSQKSLCRNPSVATIHFMTGLRDVQGCSNVSTTGQARVNPEHYVIKCVSRTITFQCSCGFSIACCVMLSNLQITLALCNFCTIEVYLMLHEIILRVQVANYFLPHHTLILSAVL